MAYFAALENRDLGIMKVIHKPDPAFNTVRYPT
jgi:hypothetical protein